MAACKRTIDYFRDDFGYRRGPKAQKQLARAIAKQFRGCVPSRERWRVNVQVRDDGERQRKVYVFIWYYIGSKMQRENGEGDRIGGRASVDMTIDVDLRVEFAVHGDFPLEYLDESIRLHG